MRRGFYRRLKVDRLVLLRSCEGGDYSLHFALSSAKERRQDSERAGTSRTLLIAPQFFLSWW
jgi:hypothetical protein